MSDGRCQMCLIACCISCFIPLLLFCIISFGSAQSEGNKLNTYIEADCLVTNSSLQKCGTTYTKQGRRECYVLQWQIQYLQYESNKQAGIIQSDSYLISTFDVEGGLEEKRRKYQIGQSYPCYHSPTNRLTAVQWEQPSKKIFSQSRTQGIVSLFILLALIVGAIFPSLWSYLKSRNVFENLQDNVSARIRTVRERSAPSTPSTAPAHVSSNLHKEEQDENISLTQLPSYVPSTV